nr:hypothetical protein [Lactiplantibacillus plantarum]
MRKKLKRRAIGLSLILSLLQIVSNNYFGTIILIAMALAALLLMPYERRENYERKNV